MATNHDIFISLRFGEAMDEAKLLQQKLSELNLSAFICEIPAGDDIKSVVIHKLEHAKLVVVLGTQTCRYFYPRSDICSFCPWKAHSVSIYIYPTYVSDGHGTVNFSTKEEMEFFLDEKIPFFLVKMCEHFEEAVTRFNFGSSVSYVKWLPGEEMPSTLPREIAEKMAAITQAPDLPAPSGASNGAASPAPPPAPPALTSTPPTPVMSHADTDADGGGSRSGRMVSSGEWTKGHCIGQGATSRVYKAIWNENGEQIAVKEMTFHHDRKRDVEKLLQEVKIMKELSHPNIVRYLGFDDSQLKNDCVAYIFCELVSGGSVDSMLSEFGPLKEKVLKRYTAELLEGLSYLHSQDPPVVHRDIKPANVLVTNEGVAKLADFGASKLQADCNDTGSDEMMTLAGTPYFMSPEAWKQVHVGRRSDVWSFGGMVLNMATGLPPWRLLNLKGQLQLMDEVLNGTRFGRISTPLEVYQEKRNPEKNHPALSPTLVNFLERCFVREYAERPYAEDLKHDPFITGTPLPAVELPPPTPPLPEAIQPRKEQKPNPFKKKKKHPIQKEEVTAPAPPPPEKNQRLPPADGFLDLATSNDDMVNMASAQKPKSPPLEELSATNSPEATEARAEEEEAAAAATIAKVEEEARLKAQVEAAVAKRKAEEAARLKAEEEATAAAKAEEEEAARLKAEAEAAAAAKAEEEEAARLKAEAEAAAAAKAEEEARLKAEAEAEEARLNSTERIEIETAVELKLINAGEYKELLLSGKYHVEVTVREKEEAQAAKFDGKAAASNTATFAETSPARTHGRR